VRGFFPLCHCFFSFWHYGIADQHMTTAIGGGFLRLNKNNLFEQYVVRIHKLMVYMIKAIGKDSVF
jgi:hypothetical protein